MVFVQGHFPSAHISIIFTIKIIPIRTHASLVNLIKMHITFAMLDQIKNDLFCE